MSLVCGMSMVAKNSPEDELAQVESSPLRLKEGALCVVSPVDFSESCFSVPAIRALKRLRAEARLIVLCSDSLELLWKSVKEVDEIVVYPHSFSARKIARLLKEGEFQFESSILWEAGEAAKAVARFGVSQRIGYPARGLEKCLTSSVDLVITPGPIEHRVRYYLNLVQALGADAFVRENFQRPPLPTRPRIQRIAIAEASEYGAAYQWPNQKFEEVKALMAASDGPVEWIPVQRGDLKIMELLSGCTALLACDGEVAHWAAHLGLPSVVIFGPGESEWSRPLGKQSKVVREHVACSPCYLSVCPLDLRCQNNIQSEKVAKALSEVLKER